MLNSYTMKPWSPEIDLTRFYDIAKQKGFLNNSSQKSMIDCFNNEREKQIWILFFDNKPIGSVASHTLDIVGHNAYRILSRNCVVTEAIGRRGMLTRNNGIKKHQNFTDQFFIPTCIEWAGRDKDLYITSNQSPIASQRLVHNIYCPTHAESGILEDTGSREYRGTIQTFWKLNVEKFYKSLNEHPRWTN